MEAITDRSNYPPDSDVPVCLGSGADGTVYGVGTVAIKVAAESESIQREYEVAKRLEKGGARGFVRHYATKENQLSMEWIKGRTLKEALKEATPAERLDLAKQAATSLADALRAGVIAGDLTFDNGLVSWDNRLTFIDFGKYKLFDPPSSSLYSFFGWGDSDWSCQRNPKSIWSGYSRFVNAIAFSDSSPFSEERAAIYRALGDTMALKDYNLILEGLSWISQKCDTSSPFWSNLLLLITCE